MDFNTQRKIVRRLEEKGKNPLLFLPCLIAKYAVILFMSLCRSVDMALSDREGNFLGIKHKQKAKKAYGDVPVTGNDFFTEKKPVRKAALPFRPLWQRAMSLLLACAFVSMSAEISASAADVILQKYTAAAKQLITAQEMTSYRSSIYEADLYTNYKNNPTYALQIENSAFNGMPNLTTITLGYSENMSIAANNFVNLAPDAAVYINTDSKEDFGNAAAQISSSEVSKIWDYKGKAYSEIPKDISVVTAYSGVGKVILKWDNLTPEPDGYAIYTYSNGKYDNKPTIITTDKAVEGDSFRKRCSAEISGASGKSQIYAVRAFRTMTNSDFDGDDVPDVTVPLYSKKFARSGSAAPLTAGKPDLSTSMSNKNVTVNISMPANASEPSYILLYCQDEGEISYSPRLKITPSQMTNGVYVFEDPTPFEGVGVRSYIAVAYYDALNRDGSLFTNQYVFPESDISTAEYTTTRSAPPKTITDAVLNSPTNLSITLSADKTMWTLKWERPEKTTGYDVYYSVYANGRPVIAETSRYLQNYAKIKVDDPSITPGENVEFSVTAHADGMTSGEPVKINVEVNSLNSVILNSVQGGNKKATVNFTAHPGTKLYTIALTHSDENGTPRTDYVKVSENDCVKSGKNLIYTLEDLQNDVAYTISVSSDADTALYSSGTKTVTPSPAPQPPAKVNVKPLENSAVISWDIVYKEGTNEPVDGYLVSVVRESGRPVFTDERAVGLTEFTPNQKLENDVNYYAYVKSYIEIEGSDPIPSVTYTRSDIFTPTVQVDNVQNLIVTPSGKTMNISWTAVKDASEYILTRTDPDGTKIQIYKGKTTSYTDTNVNNKTLYTYSVKAVRTVDGKDYISDDSTEQQRMINYSLGTVQGLTVAGGDGCIILNWDKLDGADGYYVQCSKKNENKWNTVANVGDTTFTHTGLINGDEYDYRIIPFATINNIPESDSTNAQKRSGTVGINLPAPTDFTAEAGDGQITLKWSAVNGAEGYCVYLLTYDGTEYLLDKVSKTTAIHTNLSNNTTFTYKVCAYKYVDGSFVKGDFSVSRTATVGVLLNAPTDVEAKAGTEQITISWKKTDGAEGYVVYAYNMAQMTFIPVGIVTGTTFVHTGLTPGREYTYMVAAYKNVNGSVLYSGYSLAVTATPTSSSTGTKPTDNSNTEAGDYRIYITGTTPYGMSNSNIISAYAGKGAFNNDIDVRFTLSPDTVKAVQNVLNYYGEGIDSFLMYPMDIAIYNAGTDTKATINPGYYMTITIPVPDELLPYSEHISVVHVSDLGQLEILPSIHVDVGGVDCMQFTANSFSPYAFVVYLPEIGEDTSAGTPAAAQGTAQTSTSGQSAALTFRNTYLPELYRRRARNKLYRIINR